MTKNHELKIVHKVFFSFFLSFFPLDATKLRLIYISLKKILNLDWNPLFGEIDDNPLCVGAESHRVESQLILAEGRFA